MPAKTIGDLPAASSVLETMLFEIEIPGVESQKATGTQLADFLVPLLGFTWSGTYSALVAYVEGNVVLNQNSAWVALQSTTGNAPPTLPTTANAYWELMARAGADGAAATVSVGQVDTVGPSDPATVVNVGSSTAAIFDFEIPQGETGLTGPPGIEWEGAYNGGTPYAENDVVRDQDSSWIALQATTGNAPPTLPTTSNAFWELMAQKGADGLGTGDMEAATYDPQSIAGDAFDADNHTDGTTNKVFLATERTKLAGIETAADVTDAANVAAAGAVMDGDFSTDGIMVRTGSGAYASRTLDAGAGLTGSNLDGDAGDPSLAVGAGTGILSNANDVAVDKASDANVRSAASNKVVTTDLIESASATVTLTDAATVAVDWDAFITGVVQIAANRILGNPTNGQPGTFRTIEIFGNDGTSRTLTFGNQYLNVLPVLTDIKSTQPYLLTIFCESASVFIVTATKARNF